MDENQHGLIVDLNKYRPGRDLQQIRDAGVDGFLFRIGGPAQWTEGSWGYAEDPPGGRTWNRPTAPASRARRSAATSCIPRLRTGAR